MIQKPLSFLESLRKILILERAKNYNDSAVIGGLDRYFQRWLPEAQKWPEVSGVLESLSRSGRPLPDYSSLNIEQRQNLVNSLIKIIEQPSIKTAAAPSTGKSPAKTVVSKRKPSLSTASPVDDRLLDSPITGIKGMGSALAGKFNRLGVRSIKDMLYYFPHRHLDYSQLKKISDLKAGVEQTVMGNVWEARETRLGNRRSAEAVIGDDSGNVRVVWFNQPYIAKQLRTNTQVVISGRVGLFHNRMVFESPEWEILESRDLVHTGRLVPIYPLTSGLSQRTARRIVKDTVDKWVDSLKDFLPGDIRKRCQLLELPEAIRQAHYPESETLKNLARKRLAFDELLILQLGVLSHKQNWQSGNAFELKDISKPITEFISSLPFTLTTAQQRALKEITVDLARPKPMARLLQGDVGSGKTVVAIVSMLISVFNGYQAALMAPTEILAEQHFQTVQKLFANTFTLLEEQKYVKVYSINGKKLSLALLIGAISKSEKQKLHTAIKAGDIDLVIGTHALIQKDVSFNTLGLAVVDEQHRFGVLQRSSLHKKGTNPHLLVMTATPIPRTLALTLYGDLDLTVIDQMPPGRQVIKTRWLGPDQRDRAYDFIRRKIAEGQQSFIICPLIEESDAIAAKAATTEFLRLSKEVFPDLKLGLLHGKMKTVEKEETMRHFRDRTIDILVSTAVVEVGVDIPNATIMLIESADRFGLSQLHQFRGRVGRGEYQSYCMLLAENPSPESRERLAIIERVFNGFLLAEEDLRLRGPGEFFGTRQSGLPDLKMARLSDVALLEMARNEAVQLFKSDLQLLKTGNQLLKQEMVRAWGIGQI